MSLRGDIDINLLDAFALFREYQKEINDKQIYRRTDFKRLLKAAFPHLKIGRRSERIDHGVTCVRGLSEKPPGRVVDENVVVFPTMPKKDVKG